MNTGGRTDEYLEQDLIEFLCQRTVHPGGDGFVTASVSFYLLGDLVITSVLFNSTDIICVLLYLYICLLDDII